MASNTYTSVPEEQGLAQYVADTASTIPSDMDAILHEYRYSNDPEYRKSVDYATWAAQDKPLEDQSVMMLLGMQGPKVVASYGHTVPTTVGRIANSIRENSIRSLTGLPKQEDVLKFVKDSDARDRVLHRATGNAVKYHNASAAAEQ